MVYWRTDSSLPDSITFLSAFSHTFIGKFLSEIESLYHVRTIPSLWIESIPYLGIYPVSSLLIITTSVILSHIFRSLPVSSYCTNLTKTPGCPFRTKTTQPYSFLWYVVTDTEKLSSTADYMLNTRVSFSVLRWCAELVRLCWYIK